MTKMFTDPADAAALAANEDAEIFRAVARRGMQLDPVGALAKNTAVLERARELAVDRPPTIPSGPTREELIALIAAARLSSTLQQKAS